MNDVGPTLWMTQYIMNTKPFPFGFLVIEDSTLSQERPVTVKNDCENEERMLGKK